MRIVAQPARRIRNSDRLEQLNRLGLRARSSRLSMHSQRFDNLGADREHWIERCHRLLENEADLRASDGAHVALAELEQIGAPVEADGTAVNLAGRLHESKNRQRRHRLAAARLADDAESFAAAQLEADVIDRSHDAAGNLEGSRQVLNAQEGLFRTHCRLLGRQGMVSRSGAIAPSPGFHAGLRRVSP